MLSEFVQDKAGRAVEISLDTLRVVVIIYIPKLIPRIQ